MLDTDSALWETVKPLLTAALRLDQEHLPSWRGWSKESIELFLRTLPAHCALIGGVWDTLNDEHGEREVLVFGVVCEVREGKISSLRTFEALHDKALPPVQALEPGFEHAREIMRVAKTQVAPVAWALFTDKHTWDAWLLATSEDGGPCDKKAVLDALMHEGRCVLMGNQASSFHPHHL
ncbi:hypothetical protein KSX_81940 [Ktedonospora formicarum]|uniref:Uncharacterized protein n=1 Tax=Ktedonospora formicarum TaxID=2778364 RepID=A0A8J3I7G9_9CHLR|nr:hypothetical protein KSX_81940 [Ktedonospora formicarum]